MWRRSVAETADEAEIESQTAEFVLQFFVRRQR